MFTQPQFRHAKTVPNALSALVSAGVVGVQEVQFVNSTPLAEMNYALFDVIADGVVLPREQPHEPLYWFENGNLVLKDSGSYTLRVYASIDPFESRQISVGRRIVMSDGALFKVGVPFWPQVLSQPEHGIARVANDGRNLAYVSQGFRGQEAFSYRLVNIFGQVTEPNCVYVTSL